MNRTHAPRRPAELSGGICTYRHSPPQPPAPPPFMATAVPIPWDQTGQFPSSSWTATCPQAWRGASRGQDKACVDLRNERPAAPSPEHGCWGAGIPPHSFILQHFHRHDAGLWGGLETHWPDSEGGFGPLCWGEKVRKEGYANASRCAEPAVMGRSLTLQGQQVVSIPEWVRDLSACCTEGKARSIPGPALQRWAANGWSLFLSRSGTTRAPTLRRRLPTRLIKGGRAMEIQAVQQEKWVGCPGPRPGSCFRAAPHLTPRPCLSPVSIGSAIAKARRRYHSHLPPASDYR